MALETAASAFAVVSIVDVLIRTGRDVYSFLHDITDAPDDLQRLHERIDENIILAEVSKECLQELSKDPQLTAATKVVGSFDTTLRALNRELQSLSRVIAKYKYNKKTWSRVKYVLDERKINKVLESLERVKSNLTSILTLACRQLSIRSHENVETRIKRCIQQIDSTAERRNQDTILTLENLQQTLSSKLDNQHQQTLAKQDSQTQSLVSLRKQQSGMSSRQKQIRQICNQNHKKTKQMLRVVMDANERSVLEHQKTREFLFAKLQELQITVALHSPVVMKQKRGKVWFNGNSRDGIMVLLDQFKNQFRMHEKNGTGIWFMSKQLNVWFWSELQHILASAAQEQAAQYTGSTATSFDEWLYCTEKKESPPVEGYYLVGQTWTVSPHAIQPVSSTISVTWDPTLTSGEAKSGSVLIILDYETHAVNGDNLTPAWGCFAVEARNPVSYLNLTSSLTKSLKAVSESYNTLYPDKCNTPLLSGI